MPRNLQFAAGLLHALGGRIRQVRIDRLMPVPVGGMAYCATVDCHLSGHGYYSPPAQTACICDLHAGFTGSRLAPAVAKAAASP